MLIFNEACTRGSQGDHDNPVEAKLFAKLEISMYCEDSFPRALITQKTSFSFLRNSVALETTDFRDVILISCDVIVRYALDVAIYILILG